MKYKRSDRYLSSTEVTIVTFVTLSFCGLTFLLILNDFRLKETCASDVFDGNVKQNLMPHLELLDSRQIIQMDILVDLPRGNRYLLFQWNQEQQFRTNNDLVMQQTAIVSTYILSRSQNRRFGILGNSLCKVHDFFETNLINWKANTSDSESGMYLNNESDVVYSSGKWNNLDQVDRRIEFGDNVPWATKYALPDVYRGVMTSLFRPSENCDHSLRQFYDNQAIGRKLVCASVLGITANQTELLIEFLSSFKYGNNGILVVTNDDFMIERFREIFGHYFVEYQTDTTGVEGKCDLARTLYMRQTILSQCKSLVVTPNVGSIATAFLRQDSDELYCLVNTKIVPCSRYNLSEFYTDTLQEIKTNMF